MAANYVVYGGELSYFSRKLEAALIFYGADFEFKSKNAHDPQLIEARSGTHQVPVLQTPENWMLGDTTPLLQMLDARFPQRRMFPAGPLGVLVHLIEDYFDEWIARTMVHYRWHYPESALFASTRMAEGNIEIAERVRNWGPKACRATGTDSEQQRQAAEAEYHQLLAAMELQLGETSFLLGDRPCAVDCIVLGGIRAHTNMDPDPKQQIQRYKRVLQWATSSADQWDGSGDLAAFPDSTPFAQMVLDELAATYQPYMLGHQAA
ncbi:MAG: glutathione S-transferase, partial [Candidatus Azotimanducaceae bacterium]